MGEEEEEEVEEAGERGEPGARPGSADGPGPGKGAPDAVGPARGKGRRGLAGPQPRGLVARHWIFCAAPCAPRLAPQTPPPQFGDYMYL